MTLLGNSCYICFPLWCRSSCCRASFTRSFWMLGSCQVYRSMTQRDETHYFLGSRWFKIWVYWWMLMWCVTSNLASPMAMAQWHNLTVSRCPCCPAWSSAFWTSATSWNLVEYNSSAFAWPTAGGMATEDVSVICQLLGISSPPSLQGFNDVAKTQGTFTVPDLMYFWADFCWRHLVCSHITEHIFLQLRNRKLGLHQSEGLGLVWVY